MKAQEIAGEQLEAETQWGRSKTNCRSPTKVHSGGYLRDRSGSHRCATKEQLRSLIFRAQCQMRALFILPGFELPEPIAANSASSMTDSPNRSDELDSCLAIASAMSQARRFHGMYS